MIEETETEEEIDDSDDEDEEVDFEDFTYGSCEDLSIVGECNNDIVKQAVDVIEEEEISVKSKVEGKKRKQQIKKIDAEKKKNRKRKQKVEEKKPLPTRRRVKKKEDCDFAYY